MAKGGRMLSCGGVYVAGAGVWGTMGGGGMPMSMRRFCLGLAIGGGRGGAGWAKANERE